MDLSSLSLRLRKKKRTTTPANSADKTVKARCWPHLEPFFRQNYLGKLLPSRTAEDLAIESAVLDVGHDRSVRPLRRVRRPVFHVSGFGFRVSGFVFRVSGVGFWVSRFGCRVSGFGFRISSFGCRESGYRFRVTDFEFRVSGVGSRVPGFGFRVSGFGFRVSSFGLRS